MDDKISFAVIVSIDASKVGASSVYGLHEFIKAVKRGAEAGGYNFSTGYPTQATEIEIRPMQCEVMMDLTPKGE